LAPTHTLPSTTNTIHTFPHSLKGKRPHGKKWNTKNAHETPPENHTRNIKQPKLNDYWLNQPPPLNSNKFAALTDAGIGEEEIQTQRNTPRAPPIFVAGVQNIQPLKVLLVTAAGDDFELKVLHGNQVKNPT